MPSCWQLSPFTKDKRANKGFVFPGSRKQAGPRVGLDFRAWKGELRHEWQVLKSPEPGSQGAGPGATGSVLELAEPGNPQRVSHACHAWGKLFRLNHGVAKWQTTCSLQEARAGRKPDVKRFPTMSGFCKTLVTAGKGSAIRRGTDLDLPPGQESGRLKGIVFESGNQSHMTPFTALLHGAPGWIG